jgi:hypothetical protein
MAAMTDAKYRAGEAAGIELGNGLLGFSVRERLSSNLRIYRHYLVQFSERTYFHKIISRTSKYFFLIDFYQSMRRDPP